MEITTQFVDGQQDLAAQERALNFLELTMFSKVIAYSKAEVAGNQTTPNQAVLQDVPFGQQPGPLHLESTEAGADATAIVTAQLNAGKLVVFHDLAYVSGKEQMVLGFR